MSRQARVTVLWIAVLGGVSVLVVAAGYFLLSSLGVGQPYRSWHAVGPIQVIGGPEEAWVFVEKNIVAERPGWGEHRALRVGCNQQVVIITAEGVKSRISIPDGTEVTSHKNISRIFRQNDELYLLRGESMGRNGSLFKWETDHFNLLPLPSHDEFLKVHGLDKSNAPVFEPAIDGLTEKSRWKHLCVGVDWILAPFTFTWNGQRFEIKDDRQPGTTNVRIRSLGPDNRWEDVVLQFDPTPKEITGDEYQRLWDREELGYRKPS